MFSGKFLAIIGTALAAIAVNGSPVEVAERHLEARSLGNVYFCVNDNWVGPCQSARVDSGVCYNVPANFNDKISSFGPDNGVACTLFENYGCTGRSLGIGYPGSGELSNQGFNDITSAYRCNSGNGVGK